jgi:hypothetical protein
MHFIYSTWIRQFIFKKFGRNSNQKESWIQIMSITLTWSVYYPSILFFSSSSEKSTAYYHYTISKYYKVANVKPSWSDEYRISQLYLFFTFTNHLLSFDMTWTAQKMLPPAIFHCCRNVFTELLPRNNRGIHGQTHRPYFDKIRTAQKMTCPTIILLLHVFVAMRTCLPSCCLTTKGKIHFTEPLPSNG